MDSLTDRQEMLLGLVVREYTDTAQPVSSKGLVDKYRLNISSATVRNELAELTDKGYLRQPHTSAGREPTEIGYRYFVQSLIGETELPLADQRTISHQFYQARGDMDQWLRLSAAVLARYSRSASLITAPRQAAGRFKHLELIATQGRLVLLVLVLHGGDVRQQMLTLAEPVAQEHLSAVASRLNHVLNERGAEGITVAVQQMPTLEQEIARVVADLMRKTESVAVTVISDGMPNLLAEPEFAASGSAQRALRVLEERNTLEDVLERAASPSVDGVQVVIGGENAWQELKDFSMVLARYGMVGGASGALGVFGPQRMSYGRAISTVRYVAGMMTGLMHEFYSDEPTRSTSLSDSGQGTDDGE